jgi:hypothetical protein
LDDQLDVPLVKVVAGEKVAKVVLGKDEDELVAPVKDVKPELTVVLLRPGRDEAAMEDAENAPVVEPSTLELELKCPGITAWEMEWITVRVKTVVKRDIDKVPEADAVTRLVEVSSKV